MSHKKGNNMLKKGKIFKKLDKNYRREAKFGNFFTKGRKGICRNNGPWIDLQQLQKDENKKYVLPFDELPAPFFSEKESIISVKITIQFVFNLFVDTTKKQKKQFVCVLELKLVFLNKIITNFNSIKQLNRDQKHKHY